MEAFRQIIKGVGVRQREPQSDNLYQRVAELQAKLNRANRFIKRLQQDNAQLQKQLTWLNKQEIEPSTLLVRDVPLLPEKQPNRSQRRRKAVSSPQESRSRPRRRISKRRKAKIYQLRLLGIGVSVAAVFFTVGLMLVRSINPTPAQQPSPQATAKVIKLPDSPLQPPESPNLPQPASLPTVSVENPQSLELVYNVTTPPELTQSQNLQTIVDELVKVAEAEKLPTDALSITLINVNSGEVAGYQQQELRYPASVLKIFWMVYLYAELATGILTDEEAFSPDIYKMIQQSSNSAASRIIDATTGTTSGKELEGEEYENWRRRRLHLSEFFQKAGYEGIILSQKTYSLQKAPDGREAQMWDDPQQPIRNVISSEHAARLMYDIVMEKAVSPEYSQKMLKLLARDLTPEALEDKARYGGFDPIEGYFGKSLPADIDLASKAGWSSSGRHEVAFVKTRDGKTAYILSILASDRTYANDWDIFPKMSRVVFDRLSTGN